MRSAVLSLLAVGLGLVACGGTSSTATPADGGQPGADVSACLTSEPAEGSACVAGQSVCSNGDPCCVGYAWACVGGSWTKEGLGCACVVVVDGGADAPVDALADSHAPVDAPADVEGADAGPFACGPTTTCTSSQYCTDQPPGVHFTDGAVPPDAFWCTPVPSACTTTPTCACVKAQVSGSCMVSACDDDGAGRVTIHCFGV